MVIEPIETGFGLSISIDPINKNVEINNKLNGSKTIITPRGTKVEL